MIAEGLHSFLAVRKKWKQPFLMKNHSWNYQEDHILRKFVKAYDFISHIYLNKSVSIEKFTQLLTNVIKFIFGRKKNLEWQEGTFAMHLNFFPINIS